MIFLINNNKYKIDIRSGMGIQIQIILNHSLLFYFVCDKLIQTDSHKL